MAREESPGAKLLRSHGALFVLAVRGRVQAFVPPTILSQLEQHPDVAFVEREIELREQRPHVRHRIRERLSDRGGIQLMGARRRG